MTRQVTMKEIMRATGLSRATVDRALNRRGKVHPRTEQVILETVAHLGRRGSGEPARGLSTEPRVDAVLRLGRGLLVQLQAARDKLGLPLHIVDMYQREEDDLLQVVEQLCRDPGRPLIITAKNSEKLYALLLSARKQGKRIISFVSDLPHDVRDAFVGIDNRMAGQTAAYILGNTLRNRGAATVGVVIGDYAFTCHEDREIGFRSHCRANFPLVQLADAEKGEDSVEQTHAAVRHLLQEHPGIAGIYNVAGGNLGLARALEEAGLTGKVCVVTHEANIVTIPLARSDVLQYLIAQNPAELLTTAMELAEATPGSSSKEQHLLDFGLYTRFNLPRFGLEAIG